MEKEEYLVVELPNATADMALRHTVELKKFANRGWQLVTVVGRLAYLRRPVTPDPLYTDFAQFKAMAAATESRETEPVWKSYENDHEQGGYGIWNYETADGGYVFYRQGKKMQPFDLLKILVGNASTKSKDVSGAGVNFYEQGHDG